MVRTIIKTRICCVRIWSMGRHIHSYSLGNFPRVSSSYLVNMLFFARVKTVSVHFQCSFSYLKEF